MQDLFQEKSGILQRQVRQERQQSLTQALAVLQENDRDPDAYCAVAQGHRKLQQLELAIPVLREGLRRCAPSSTLYRTCIRALEESNRTAEAIAVAQEASLLWPADFFLKLKEALLLPIVYQSTAEIEHYRRRYAEGLGRLAETLSLDTPESRRGALEGIGSYVNTNLPYQNHNDRDLQTQFGRMVHRILTANYPQWAAPVPMPPASPGEKLRIGYVSTRFRDRSAARYFLGWLREHDPRRFAIHAYHLGEKTDSVTGEVRRASYRFRHLPNHLPNDLEETCRAILADRLHILVFLDVGLQGIMTQLAALRLAPVQCLAWDQPVTSGLPTMDYFLSSALTEPEGAQNHYSETLVRLPGIGVCFAAPVIPRVLLTKTRRDFGLPEDAVIYLCCQSAMKWLPQQDELFVEIARRVPAAVFVFLTMNQPVRDDLGRRLEGAFAAAGLRAADHCILMPELDRFSYWNLNLIGDVFLDSIGWTGGVSTFDAVACRLPVATLPGEFMRGRQSSAILTQLGVAETIARDAAEYVAIAARLGTDPAWRERLAGQMARGGPSLFSDTRSVAALEEFFERTVAGRLDSRKL